LFNYLFVGCYVHLFSFVVVCPAVLLDGSAWVTGVTLMGQRLGLPSHEVGALLAPVVMILTAVEPAQSGV